MPSEEPISQELGNKIMHVSLPICDATQLMGSDSMQEDSPGLTSAIAISINAQSEQEAITLFQGLAQNGTITMPLEKTFWGALFGMLTDSFGVQWMVNYDYPVSQ